MNKLRLFLDNIIVYGVGGIISKIIPLIMVPIIAYIMPNSEYFGIYDMTNTIISFASALALMGMYDAMYRMFFEREDDEYKKKVCSTSLIVSVVTSIFVFILLIIFRKYVSILFFKNREFSYLIYMCAIATLVGSTNSIISAPTRMQNKKSLFILANAVSPLVSYGISIPLLLSGYYVIALPLAGMISSILMEIFFYLVNRKWFKLEFFDKDLLKPLLIIALPLLPNFLIYWIFNSCDRVMITNILGLEEAGVYSMASKIGQCSQLIYTAFAGGWQYFAFSTMKDRNQVVNNSRIFEYLGVISFISTMIVMGLSYYIFALIFPDIYLKGYIVAPYLFLAPLLQMLFQVACNQFIVVKKTWPNLFILGIGAAVNIILNNLLIPYSGIEGAAIATILGYIISVILCAVVLKCMNLFVGSFRFLVVVILFIFDFILWRYFFNTNILYNFAITVAFVVISVVLYRYDLKRLINQVGMKMQ